MSCLKNPLRYRQDKSKKILLVDDEKDLGWVMKNMIRDAGHRLLYANSFREGVKKFKTTRNLDIAIVDLRLKDGDGLSFIKKIKGFNGRVRFVMISAFGAADTKAKARRLGISHFLDKPIKIESLLAIINGD